ncbi:uncharacterized protein LY89DRAFT_785273 [Mollisia scopiformis]|uniref:Uncharacterized protein n=1 Tax=Mollisia scopiformis TaxID=149040 RepID=A0A194X0A8_MOLSC|nr:uncharacterized protein LY89DRAFT_785273 [Mollisia scopiformis]KUJ13630.1 hypothetical protein LY89DRAFT_785273 [Mollisia scopiformis]
MVSELREEYIGTVAGMYYEAGTRDGHTLVGDASSSRSLVSPMGIWLRGKIEETSFDPSSISSRDINDLKDELVKLESFLFQQVKRIPSDTENSTYEDNENFNSWAKVLLSALGSKNWWFLHSPILHRALSQNIMILSPLVVTHSRNYLQKFLFIACAKDFQWFQWAWPGNHQPLHAIMILLKEVEQNPFGPDSELSRNIVDQAFALCNIDGGISGNEQGNIMPRPLTEGGQEAWEFIRRLRARAWIKAGLDPDLIMTREDVLKVLERQLEAMKLSDVRQL